MAETRLNQQKKSINIKPRLQTTDLTSTAGAHQMRPFCRHLFIIVVIIVVVVIIGHLKSFQPQKPRFSSFENNMGPTDDGWTDGRTDGHDLL